ncbi:tellurium resistance protein [Pararhodobacter sp.]|uniref:SLAC1 family transporter n=1 Tax=Pararhodobacter sp. TaxID=2127056 RepID=UPI002AFF11F7|nr:tellurium resistance protein [Pararhodobacter sp.]
MSDSPRPVPSIKPRHFPPPPPLVQKTPGLWRRTPPAIFSPVMGMFGLGLSWRNLALQPGMAPLQPVGEAILGAVLLLYAFALVAWLSKPLRRPGVVMEELAVLPGRAGTVAMVLSFILAGAALRPYAPDLAFWMAVGGMGALAVVGSLITWRVGTGPREGRGVTPVFHLTYVGYILAPLTLIPLGYVEASKWILWLTMPAAALIWLASLRQLIRTIPPAPLRPFMAIHAAPASLFATVSALLGYQSVALVFAIFALALITVMIVKANWLLHSGFSPLWASLTFPMAAVASAAIWGLGAPGLWIGAAILAFATGFIPWITFRVYTMWAKGELGPKTNAATA